MNKSIWFFDPATFERNARIYKLMAHPKRLAILNLLRVYYHISHPKIVEPCKILRDLWQNHSLS